MNKGELSRARFIAAAADALERRGYHGAGLNEILEASGAPRGSLYFHFPGGKEQLAVEALQVSAATVDALMGEAFASTRSLTGAARRVVQTLADRAEASDFTKGCPVAAVALDGGGGSEQVREAAADAYRAWIQRIADALVAAGMRRPESQRRAELFMSAVEGALILARAYRDRGPLDRLIPEIPRLLGAE